jgi:DtxR family Mn-dependent transcriptional regulator
MKKPTKAIEDYLEALLILEEKKALLETTTLAQQLKVSKPAVTQMLQALSKEGYIRKAPYGDISLTPSGREVAEKTYHRHKILCFYLESIGVSPTTAEQDCCQIEHVISEETFEAIEALYISHKKD